MNTELTQLEVGPLWNALFETFVEQQRKRQSGQCYLPPAAWGFYTRMRTETQLIKLVGRSMKQLIKYFRNYEVLNESYTDLSSTLASCKANLTSTNISECSIGTGLFFIFVCQNMTLKPWKATAGFGLLWMVLLAVLCCFCGGGGGFYTARRKYMKVNIILFIEI